MNVAVAKYQHLPPEDVAALSPKERADYQAQRQAFDAEVRERVAIARETGRVDVTPIDQRGKPCTRDGRPVFIEIPVQLVPRRSHQ